MKRLIISDLLRINNYTIIYILRKTSKTGRHQDFKTCEIVVRIVGGREVIDRFSSLALFRMP